MINRRNTQNRIVALSKRPIVRKAAASVAVVIAYSIVMEHFGYKMVRPDGLTAHGESVVRDFRGNRFMIDHTPVEK